jgi:translocator protein
MNRPRQLKPIIIAALAALTVAMVGGLITDIGPWYLGLVKPTWQPPDWLFGPAWTLIFSLAAASGVLAWRDAPNPSRRIWMLALFAVNGLLNVLWSFLFFKLHRPDWALMEVGFLWLSVAVLMVVLGRYSRMASWLLAPYLAWIAFAAFLNWTTVQLNGPF